jgi:glutamate racemase
LKDAQFLLSNKYNADENAKTFNTDKESVKAIIIACNTATAYGKDSIVSLLNKAGLNIPVIGVIDAGAKGALDVFSKDENGSIGVFATVGTIASNGYENTLNRLKNELGYTGNIQIYNQGGHGVAEVVDEEPEYIDRAATAPRTSYLGPSLTHEKYKIDLSLLDIYNFDFSNNKMLYEGSADNGYTALQINSADNYIRYHLVELMEQLRKANAQPLKTIILGCTHYPYLLSEINSKLNELYDYKKDGKYYYRDVMSKNIDLINPAENVAIELHTYLNDNKLFSPNNSMKDSEFYISVPNKDNKNVITDEHGRFTYDYKYGRNANAIQEYVKVVPFSKQNVQKEVLKRLEKMIPNTFALIVEFNQHNLKTAGIAGENKISPTN